MKRYKGLFLFRWLSNENLDNEIKKRLWRCSNMKHGADIPTRLSIFKPRYSMPISIWSISEYSLYDILLDISIDIQSWIFVHICSTCFNSIVCPIRLNYFSSPTHQTTSVFKFKSTNNYKYLYPYISLHI